MAFATLNIKDGTETIVTCLSTICLTEELADVYFAFPKEKAPSIPGHKMILSLRSPVFKAMFYGTFPQLEGDVKILDIKANTFKMLIRYIYTDKVDISGSSVISVLYAAQKYQLVPLLSKCETYLSKHLNANNACTIYSQAKFFSMHQLQAGALKCIAEKADDVFGSDDFLSFTPEDLIDILKLDSLCISEVKIFQSVLKWTDRRLAQSKKAVNGKSRRGILLESNILYMVAIPLLSLNDYTEIVLPSGLLTDEEQLHIFKVITVKDKQMATEGSKFRICPRKGNNIFTISVQKIISSVNNSVYGYGQNESMQEIQMYNLFGKRVGENEVIHLRPNSDIKVVSVNIKPRFRGYGHYGHVKSFSETTVSCTFAGKSFQGVYVHEEGLKLEINQKVPSGQIVEMDFSFGGDNNWQNRIERVPERFPVYGDEYCNQQDFSYSYIWSEGMSIDFEFSGVHLVASIDIKRL